MTSYDSATMPMYELRALYLLRNNIAGLLTIRRETQVTLARAVGKKKSWINKILNGQRGMQMEDLDGIASFFGVAPYQLFQPGTAQITERRSGQERRSGHDRRVSHLTRQRDDQTLIAIRAVKNLEADYQTGRVVSKRPKRNPIRVRSDKGRQK